MSKRLLACVLGVLTLLVASATATAAPGPPGVQTADQSAGSQQGAVAASAATQYGASNKNVPIRVGSEGDNGSVEQSNDASSKAEAENENKTDQDADQSQAGSSCCTSAPAAADAKAADPKAADTKVAEPKADACCASTPSVQTADQSADSKQAAAAHSAAVQKKPSNTNISIRVGSEGHNGSVDQSNEVSSKAEAENENKTKQDVDQWQIGHDRCGCADGLGIQVAGQSAKSLQGAFALSAALQAKPSNSNKPASVWSPGDGGSVDQSNDTDSEGEAENGNRLKQLAHQLEL
jgi:hypothetical protein